MSVVKPVINDQIPPWMPPMMDVSGIKRKFLDIPYASESPRQVLDLYLPDEGIGPFPTIIYMHGGAWIGGDKRDMQAAYVMDGITRGYAVISVEQRLSPAVTFPYPLFDFKAAIRFLRANAEKYMLDASHFASAGDSAGAYHVVMAAATQDIPQFEDLTMGNASYSSKVNAVIGFFGSYDMIAQSKFTDKQDTLPGFDFINYADTFTGVRCPAHPGLMYFTNVLNFISPSMPPVLLQAGDCDEVAPFEVSVELAEKIKAVCGPDRVEFDIFAGCTHGDPAFATPENQERIFSFLDKYLK